MGSNENKLNPVQLRAIQIVTDTIANEEDREQTIKYVSRDPVYAAYWRCKFDKFEAAIEEDFNANQLYALAIVAFVHYDEPNVRRREISEIKHDPLHAAKVVADYDAGQKTLLSRFSDWMFSN